MDLYKRVIQIYTYSFWFLLQPQIYSGFSRIKVYLDFTVKKEKNYFFYPIIVMGVSNFTLKVLHKYSQWAFEVL